jgi:hypothetical protein
MKSTSIWRSRQTSRYSGFVVRTIVCVRGDRLLVNIAAMMFGSSREVHAIRRSAPVIPASWSVRRLAPLPSTVATSKRCESAERRDASRSSTTRSCSVCRASTIVVPTCPAPMMKILTSRERLTPRGVATCTAAFVSVDL